MLSGALPSTELTGRRLYDAMDLCLECKGCKAECQTGVDMAKLKYEFLDRYHRAQGLPLRARVFANINTLSRLGAPLAPLANWAAGNPLGKRLLHALLGIHSQRSLPPLARTTFPKWFSSRRPPSGDGRGGSGAVRTKRVLLFNDTFMNYNYPHVGMAAVEVLERAGFAVELAAPSGGSRAGGRLLRTPHGLQGDFWTRPGTTPGATSRPSIPTLERESPSWAASRAAC